MALARYIVSFILAMGISLGVFYVMQSLISQRQDDRPDIFSGKVIDFVRLREDSALETRKRRLPQKQEKEEAPKPPPMNLSRNLDPGADALSIGGPEIDLGIELGGPNLGAFEGDAEAVPIVRVQAVYPERAAARGIEGWVDIQFTITVTGAVKDEVVIASYPSSIFNRSALKAVHKFKYKPKVVDGQPVEQHGQKIRISFEMDK